MRGVLGAAILALAAAAAGEPRRSDDPGASCRACHPRQVESYAATGMAHALEPVGPRDLALLARLDGVREPGSGFGYHFEVVGETARVVETWERPGAPASPAPAVRVGSAELHLAIGAGRVDRSYAASLGGAWWLAPLEVLGGEGRERRAVLAPAHEQVAATRFAVPVGRACLRCHTDRPPPPGYPHNRQPAAEEGWVPTGVSCAACHGDVEGHERWQREPGARAPDGHDPIALAWSMSQIERVSTCARCHLQGDARIALTPQGAGLPPVGDDLLEHAAYFGAPAGTDDIGFVSQVERLVQSRCFTESTDRGPRALSCETCHDPHRSTLDPAERARVRAACGACHAPAGSGDSPAREAAGCSRRPEPDAGARDCVDCHMRLTPVFDLSGVRVHDHRIERRPPPPSSFEHVRAQQSTGALERFAWPGTRPPLEGDPGLELMALLELGRAGPALALVDEEPAPEVARLPEWHHARGVLLESRELDRRLRGLELDAERMEQARRAYARALELDPERVETALRLAPLTAWLGHAGEALELADRVVARWPRAPEPLRTRAVVQLALGRQEAALADYEAAFELHPGAGEARSIAELHERLARPEQAAAWRARAARLDPSR